MTPKTPPFLMWYDDHPKHSLGQKIQDACAAYTQRFGLAPRLALLSSDDADQLAGLCQPQGLELRVVTTVRRNTVWVGQA